MIWHLLDQSTIFFLSSCVATLENVILNSISFVHMYNFEVYFIALIYKKNYFVDKKLLVKKIL